MDARSFTSLFEDSDAWQVFASGQATGILSATTDENGNRGLRLDYDFHGGGGFVVIRRELKITLPDAFRIGFHIRGGGPQNHFECKVADSGGANVWRHLRSDFKIPTTWSDFQFNERDLPFAWGPAGGGAPSEVEAIEFVIAAGPGGKGSLELASASLENQALRTRAAILASSQRPGFPPESVFTTNQGTGWKAEATDNQPWWMVDFGKSIRFGGLLITWPEGLPPRGFHIEISPDAKNWTPVYQADSALGPMSHIPTPGAEARHLRIRFGNSRCAALASLVLKPDAFTHTPNEFIHCVAADYPRGWFPRYWHREQSYWTPVGSPEGGRRALINEEGMVEVDEAGFSLEPFLLTNRGLVTWAEAEISTSLPKGGMPLPVVIWKADGFRLEVMPWVDGRQDNLTLHVSYRLKCKLPGTRLIVAARPFQVNPPWQAFRNLGGRSPIHHIACNTNGLHVDQRQVAATPRTNAQGAAAFAQGGVLAFLAQRTPPPRQEVADKSGLASAAMAWDLPTDKTTLEVTVSVPYFTAINPPAKRSRAVALARWRRTLGKVRWDAPAAATPAFDCFRTAAAHILINRDGPAIQPGPRRYTRSWVRDCVIMGAALAKAGIPRPLRAFVEWYAQFQRDDGFVPCVVDRDGIDWIVEHDSHGQFLWGIREVFRNFGDRKFLERLYPHARRAADYLIQLRAERMTNCYRNSACFGLLPESASHEGYLAHPVHSYWDDFWSVRGLEAAADLADELGRYDNSACWRNEASGFQKDLLGSIEHVIAEKGLNYIPGSVEWADFDPTATSNAIALLDFAGILPSAPLEAMLETYLDGFRRKHRGEMQWNNYTAYEIRIIGAFVRLGKRDEANELLSFFLSDRRPREWNQWPEITWRDPRSPGHLGDVPHTWIAAEYLLALASMVAAEREATNSMVLAAGMPWSWISTDGGFAVENLPTRFGALDFKISAVGTSGIHLEIGGSIHIPTGGLGVAPPIPPGMRITAATDSHGETMRINPPGNCVAVECLPVSARLNLASAYSEPPSSASS